MFERFTQDARMALFFARYAVSQRGGEQMELQDLLWGIMVAAPSAVVRFAADESVLPPHGETAEDVFAREDDDDIVLPTPRSVAIPFSTDFQLTFERSVAEVDALGHHAIRPEHLVLGLLREEGTQAWNTLHRAGLTLREVRRMLKAEPEESAGNNATCDD
jgi:ATP-dependent Clp protease ATP-binding subunit ClpA